MKKVRIHEKNYDIVLFLNKNSFFGYKFNKDNTIEKIDKSVFKYFDFFICSNNYESLSDEDDYKVMLDKDTNFKHYFKNGSEDYEMFFRNNGKLAINFQSDKSLKNILRDIAVTFVVGSTTISLSLTAFNYALLHSNNLTLNNNIDLTEEQQEDKIIAQIKINDITYKDVSKLINDSINLDDEEKAFLDNEALITDVLEIINDNNISKYDLLASIKDIDIKPFDEEYTDYIGYYKSETPNVIYVRDYNGLTSSNKDTVAHEYMHLFQYNFTEYDFLKEACAEIISDEYYDESSINTYSEQVKIVKKLMEIIGPDAIWYFNFTGDISLIEENVKPYLNENLYNAFLDCLKYDYEKDINNTNKITALNHILEVLYKNKYNQDISNDEIIKLIDDNEVYIKRYYFNKRYINSDYSYYEDNENVTSVSMTKNEAIINDYLIIEEGIKEFIEPNEIYEFLKNNPNIKITRQCTYNDQFKETGAGCVDGVIKVCGYLDNVYLDNITEEELINRGIIKNIKYYYIKERKLMTKQDYFDKKYNKTSEIYFTPNHENCHHVSLNNENDFEVYFSSKIKIPTIYEKFEDIKVRRKQND